MSVGKIIDTRFIERLKAPPGNRRKTIRKKKFRHKGITAAAEELGVSVMHVWYVLKGIRQSRRIENSEWFRRTVAARAEFEKQQQKGHGA